MGNSMTYPSRAVHVTKLNWITWWRHQMETFSALLALCVGNSSVPDEFPTQRPVTRSFDVFFELCLNKRLSKQLRGWWFEMPSFSFWRHCNVCLLYGTNLVCCQKLEALVIMMKFQHIQAWKIFLNEDCCILNQILIFLLSVFLRVQLHEPRIFYPSGHWPETVTNAHVSAHFRYSLGASVISTHIRTEGLYVKTIITYQLKRLCIPDFAYMENMLINFIHVSLYDISLTQNILYQIKRDVAVWKRLGCPQRNQRTWWQIMATPYTGLA